MARFGSGWRHEVLDKRFLHLLRTKANTEVPRKHNINVADSRLQVCQKHYHWKGNNPILNFNWSEVLIRKVFLEGLPYLAILKYPNGQRWENVNLCILWSDKETFLADVYRRDMRIQHA